MPRKSSKREVGDLVQEFMDEAKADLMKEVLATRQPSRRRELLAAADGLDSVSKRFYAWLNGRFAA
jgi:hypothetical protein